MPWRALAVIRMRCGGESLLAMDLLDVSSDFRAREHPLATETGGVDLPTLKLRIERVHMDADAFGCLADREHFLISNPHEADCSERAVCVDFIVIKHDNANTNR
jgi:hypothetical protein